MTRRMTIEESDRRDPWIDPFTSEPYRQLNQFSYERLPPDVKRCYAWNDRVRSYLYQGPPDAEET